jgi:isopentenyl diphosphate isomerase/L-lactate dehydrogenase-like FMN-dependent dehydrogenase
MEWVEIRKAAKERFNGFCRLCPTCNGVVCAGEVPGMGGIGTGASFKNNVEALLRWRLNLRVVHGVKEPTLQCKLFGHDLAMPVLAAAIGGAAFNLGAKDMSEDEYQQVVVEGCVQAGTVGMTGDGPKPEFFLAGIKAIKSAGGKGIPIIKPREPEKIVELANQAADAGCIAFGVDVDAAALVNMTRAGQPVAPRTRAELEYVKRHTKIPFIAKGIMTVDEAEACVSAGIDAIVVSNHGGRALDHTPGTAEVLPEITQAVKGRILIMADGGVRTGSDVLKMLALGADIVLVGRPVTIGALGGGVEGVRQVMERIGSELRTAMLLTGSPSPDKVSRTVLRLQG